MYENVLKISFPLEFIHSNLSLMEMINAEPLFACEITHVIRCIVARLLCRGGFLRMSMTVLQFVRL